MDPRLLICWSLLIPQFVEGQNYIRYHQRALEVYQDMLNADPVAALEGLRHLEDRYALLPPETYALAFNAGMLGDTVTAARYFLKAAEQGAAMWMFLDRAVLSNRVDTVWFNALSEHCWSVQLERMPWVDGPNPGKPVPTTRSSVRYQTVIDSLSHIHGGYGHELNGHPEAQRAYRQTVLQHDLVLDSIMEGDIEMPSIQRYGMNGEFDTFLYHVSPEHLYAQRKTVRKWLRDGLIFPRIYANCFDQLARMKGTKMPYGVLHGWPPNELLPGFEERRRSIGMGDERIDRLRFHWVE